MATRREFIRIAKHARCRVITKNTIQALCPGGIQSEFTSQDFTFKYPVPYQDWSRVDEVREELEKNLDLNNTQCRLNQQFNVERGYTMLEYYCDREDMRILPEVVRFAAFTEKYMEAIFEHERSDTGYSGGPMFRDPRGRGPDPFDLDDYKWPK